MTWRLLLLALLVGAAVVMAGCGTKPQDTAEAEAIRVEAYQNAADRAQARQQRAIEHSQQLVQDALDRERNRQAKEAVMTTLPWAILTVVTAFIAGVLTTVAVSRRCAPAEGRLPTRNRAIERPQHHALPGSAGDDWLPALVGPVNAKEEIHDQ
jgi:Flp pilus assembly protein TadB